MLVFVERGKPEYPEKKLSEQGENQQQTQPKYDAGTENWTRATLVGGECSDHYTNPTTAFSLQLRSNKGFMTLIKLKIKQKIKK